jgi:predicted adenine nucleotide alpha hydrolase (AANH) superfamily ATPase
VKKVLLHICCGPCATYPVPWLRDQGYMVMGYYSNSNIHPYSEYIKRQEALAEYAQIADFKVIWDQEYNPVKYFQNMAFRESNRCMLCYSMRLENTAHIARKGNFDFFTTTLLVSKHQNHELIRSIGDAAGKKLGVEFLYHDFREGYKQTIDASKKMGLYRQQYCGCLYSEIERYAPRELVKNMHRTQRC